MKKIIVLATLVFIASGCAKNSNEQAASDAKSLGAGDTAMQSGAIAGHGDSATMSGRMTVSEDVEKDMSMMNDMMVSDLGEGDSLFDHRFIDMMIPHHEGAIMMARNAQREATRPELLKLAESIIAGQQKEIDQMKEWRAKWYGVNSPNGMANSSEMMNHMSMMNDMMVKHLGRKGANYESGFIGMMIPHHAGAIMMAEHAQARATHAEIRKLSQSIIGAQKQEVAQMERWRIQWYGR